MTLEIEAEICILGGGPAGSVMARRLAEFGHDALLIDRTAEQPQPRGESLAPSILPILDSLQLRSDVDAAAFCRERRALLLWETDAIQEKSFATAPSLLVERTRFDRRLRKAASRRGVRVIAAARARSPQRLASGGWAVPVITSSGSTVVKAAFLVDARGKRHRVDLDDRTPRTAAISAIWTPSNQSFAETRIEAGDDEWFWGSPLPGRCYVVTIFLNSERLAGLGTASRTELYRQVLTRSKLLGDLLRSETIGPVCVRDATPRISRDLIGNDFIRVGEAALTIDPLSSQGIQDALLSAIQGSAAVHTILTAECNSNPAIEFYRERRHTAAAKSRLTAARFYRAHPERSSFWVRRSSAAESPATPHEQQARTELSLPSELRISPALQVVEVPILAGALIRRAPALCHPGLEQPVAYLDGVALAPLIQEAGEASATDHILSRWTRHLPPETAGKIMSWMWTVGILDAQPSASQDHAISGKYRISRDHFGHAKPR